MNSARNVIWLAGQTPLSVTSKTQPGDLVIFWNEMIQNQNQNQCIGRVGSCWIQMLTSAKCLAINEGNKTWNLISLEDSPLESLNVVKAAGVNLVEFFQHQPGKTKSYKIPLVI